MGEYLLLLDIMGWILLHPHAQIYMLKANLYREKAICGFLGLATINGHEGYFESGGYILNWIVVVATRFYIFTNIIEFYNKMSEVYGI